jgi:MerR family copper efflux transcriptional regulator
MKPLKSGELAKQANVNPETLRYYEREGLLSTPQRTENGYRLYSETDVRQVRFIKRAQELGFSLKEIRELLALRLDASQSASEVKQLAQQKIVEIEDKIQSLQAMKATLNDLAQACSGEGSVDHCPILNCLDDCIPRKGGENECVTGSNP